MIYTYYNCRCLRSLSVALDLPPQSVTLDGTLRASTVLMLLFSHAGTELNSPHVALGWNIEKFSSWWESHTLEKDRYYLKFSHLYKFIWSYKYCVIYIHITLLFYVSGYNKIINAQ